MTNYSHEENAVIAAVAFKMHMQQVTEKVVEEQFQDICGAESFMKKNRMKRRKKFRLKIWSELLPKWKTTSLKYMILWKKSTSALWKSQGLLILVLSYPLT